MSCESPPSTAPATSASRSAPRPRSTAPTDAIVKVTAGCICGSDLWPYRGENDITAGRHDRPRDDRRRRGGRRRGHRRSSPATSWSRRSATATTPAPHCRAGVTSACVNVGFTTGGQGEYAKVTQAEGSLVKTDGMPDDSLLPSLLTLSDVFPTGWHCAVAAGVKPGDTVVVVGDGAVGLCGVLAAAADGRRARGRDVAPRAAAGDRPPVRGDPHRGRARQGRRRAHQGADRRHRRRRRAGVRRHRRLDEAGLRLRPARARRSASSGCPTASTSRCAGCSARTSGWPAAWRPCAATCPSCSTWSPPAPSTPVWSSTPGCRSTRSPRAIARWTSARAIKVYLEV